jgi:hypothetical protein
MFDYREADEKTSPGFLLGCFFRWLGELGMNKIEWTTGEEDRPRLIFSFKMQRRAEQNSFYLFRGQHDLFHFCYF